MKRFWIMLVAAAVVLAIAAPAAGKKPPKPTHFNVTFEFATVIDDNGQPITEAGFSTAACANGGLLGMEAGPGGRLMASPVDFGVGDVPLLDVNLPGLDWYRVNYPYYVDADAVPPDFDPDMPFGEGGTAPKGTNLTGCHGAGIDVIVDGAGGFSIEQAPRFLMLTVGNGSVAFRWEADYYREWSSAESRNPRKSPTLSISDMEGFSYNTDTPLSWIDTDSGEPVVWDKTKASSGLVTGEINVSHFSPGVYEPFPGSPVRVEFMMTIAPTSE